VSATPAPTATPTAATAVPSPPPPTVKVSSGNVSGGLLITALLSGAVIAAFIAATVNVWQARRKSREDERARVRGTLAEAYQAYAEYKEFPFAIRRRRADQPAEERVRLSEALRQVQARLSYYETWTRAEHEPTGRIYKELVTQCRIVAGGSMGAAWTEPALDNDAGMNIGPDVVDLRDLTPYEEAFINAATAHVQSLGLTWWQRRRQPKPPSTPTSSGAAPPPADTAGPAGSITG
jgi:hypothetical protein